MYFQGPSRIRDSLLFLKQQSASWSRDKFCNFLFSHLWWHFALVLVEDGNIDDAIKIYDTQLFPNDEEYRNDLQVQINAMELLWKIEARIGSKGSIDSEQYKLFLKDRWTNLQKYVDLKITKHFDLLHSFLTLRGYQYLENKIEKIKSHELFFDSLEKAGYPEKIYKEFEVLCRLAVNIFEGKEVFRKELKALDSTWSVVGNSTEQRAIFLELSEGKPVVCGKIYC